MKVEINFSSMPNAPVKLLSSLLSGAAGITLLLCIWFTVSARDFTARTQAMQATQVKLGKRIADMKQTPGSKLPDSTQISAFKEKVALINSLDKGEGMHTSLVLAKLEGLLPGSAYLINFRYQREPGEIMLTAESAKTAPLALFLHRIEKSEAFSHVLLIRQLQAGPDNNKRIQYSIKFTGRPQ